MRRPSVVAEARPAQAHWMFAAIAAMSMGWLAATLFPEPLMAVPDRLTIDLALPVSKAFDFVTRDIHLFGRRLSHWTRAAADIAGMPLDLLRGLLADGFKIYRHGAEPIIIPPVPWPATIAVAAVVVWKVAGSGLAGATVIFLGLVGAFGLWQSAMQTLAAATVSVSASVLLGLWLGIAAYRNPRLRSLLDVVFDIMQTLPVFSYLVPLLVFFGFGPSTALIATIIFAMPPMARVTALGLHQVPAELKEFADMVGCTPRQQLWWVLLPAARKQILLGANQSVLFTLAMVIIASVIGAGGLGSDVLNALRGLRMGDAISAGLAITVLAVLVDRSINRWSERSAAAEQTLERRPARSLLFTLLATTALSALSVLAASLFPGLAAWPEALTVDQGGFWGDMVSWINTNLGYPLSVIRDSIILYVLRPVRDLLTAMPWVSFTAAFAIAVAAVGGWRLALATASVFSLIAISGYWERAMISLHLVVIAAMIAAAIGVPVGLWAGLRPRIYPGVKLFVDTLQTLPTFVYLIPVVVIFGVGDVPALLAIVLFAVAPAIRYTAESISQVPETMLEVAEIAGASAWQKLLWIQVPAAAPQIILGLNQTLMMAFNMLVITALVGTRGLEQLTLQSIVQLNPGQGLMAGLAISAMAIILDRILRRVSDSVGHARQPGQ